MFILCSPSAEAELVGGDNTSAIMWLTRIGRESALSAAGVLMTVSLAASAHADTNDAAFFDQLDRAGIEFADAQDAVSAAQGVCNYLAEGRSVTVIARAIKMRNHHLSNNNALQFVEIAGETYCPEQLSAAVSG